MARPSAAEARGSLALAALVMLGLLAAPLAVTGQSGAGKIARIGLLGDVPP